MSAEPTYETQRIDHLGIVSGVCREIGLIEQVNAQVKAKERKVSCGCATQAFILNALGFVGRAVYLMPDYLHNKPVDLLIDPALTAEDFNDDTLGRCLDDLYEAGVTEVFYHVASHALQVYGLRPDFVHLDSSSFHLHGAYDVREPEREAISVTYGYSKDHRPDLKQVVMQLITGHKSALPVWLEVLSGNSNDKKTFTASVKAYCEQLKADPQPYLVMDSAGFSEDTVKEAQTQKVRWLMRVPETLGMAKKLVKETPQDAMKELEPGYLGKEVVCEYAGIAQRWLIVFSEAARNRELKTLEKAQAKELVNAQKDWRKFAEQTFNCQEDAEAALAQWNQKWKYHRVQAQLHPLLQFPHAGRPTAQDQKQVSGYLLQGEVQVEETALETAKRSLGRFIIATNDLDPLRLSSQAMLENYKDQGVSVERGFRFLKDPMFFAHSLFLKKPKRLMALLMVMGLSLLIYSLAERKLRGALREKKATVPDQRRKPTSTPTIRWVFQLFEGLDILLVRQNGQVIQRQLLNVSPVQKQIISLLGPLVQNCYLFSS
jgi:transposase